MPDPLAYVRYVFVGRPPAPDRIPDERLSFYRWLAPAALARNKCRVVAKDLYVTMEEMRSNPQMIKSRLEEIPDDGDKKSVAVIDLAASPFHLIRDIFLFYVADTAMRWLASRPKQTIVILLPGARLPASASMFWNPFRETSESDYRERLIVIGDDGTVWPDRAKSRIDRADYLRQRSRSKEDLIKQLELRVIQKPGHYDFGSRERPHCSRYYFEAEQAEQEIGELVVEWIENDVRPSIPPGEALALVSHGKESVGFHDAVAGAASLLGTPFGRLSEDGMIPQSIEASSWVAPVFNVVHTGATFRRVITKLVSQGAKVTHAALTVMVTDKQYQSESNGTHLYPLCRPFDREKLSKADCIQCQLGLRHTPSRGEAPVGLRSFDMWDILLEARWGKEPFGAKPEKLYRHVPDMREVFKKHGNYFAYRVHQLLKTLGADEVAFVCPAEANVEELVTHLGILLQNRQVTVRVPPKLLRSARLSKNDLLKSEDEDWHRQLRHLGNQRFANVVIIDETAASKSTANGLIRLLRLFDLQPLAFIPILDFSPERRLGEVQILPLYQIPNPRRDR